MPIFNKIKQFISGSSKQENAKMQVCMMGARGVGKTSILTSMFNNLNEVNSTSELYLTTFKGESEFDMTEDAILKKKDELQKMFSESGTSDVVTTAGIQASMEERDYNFQFGVKGKNVRIDLVVKDYPGEFIISETEKVREFVDNSNAIIIAIDTPHLMEENGRYNEAKNTVSIVTKFIKDAFSNLESDKLVLFVPLKCEKYNKEGRMDEVTDAVIKAYSELIEFLGGAQLKTHVAAVVTPIFTVGEIIFRGFKTDENGEIITTEMVWPNGECEKIPMSPEYIYSKKNAEYKPMYCEQPLCYLLSFITKLYHRESSTGAASSTGFFAKMAALFKLFPDDPGLLMAISKFSRKKVMDKDGYRIICGGYLV